MDQATRPLFIVKGRRAAWTLTLRVASRLSGCNVQVEINVFSVPFVIEIPLLISLHGSPHHLVLPGPLTYLVVLQDVPK